MQYPLLLVLLLFLSGECSGQSRVSLRDLNLEPWRETNFLQAMALDEVFGAQRTTRVRKPISLVNGSKLTRRELAAVSSLVPFAPVESLEGTPSPARSATALPPPPHQLEGFLALADDNLSIPPDCAGAVSPAHVMTVLNSEVRVQERQGNNLRTVTIERFFAPAGPFESAVFDPRVLWDQTNKRWVIIALSDPGGRAPALLLAVSANENPLGDWRVTRLLNAGAVGLEFDFPQVALSGPFLLISVNIFRGSEYRNTQNNIFLLEDLYAARTNLRQFEDFLSTNTPVADPNRANNRGLFVNVAIGVFDASLRLLFREVQRAGSTEVRILDRVVAQAGDLDPNFSGQIMPQQGSPVLIDGGNVDLANCTARDSDVWCVGTIFQRFGTQRTSMIQVYQFNWVSPPGTPVVGRVRIEDTNFANFYAYPSIAVNKNRDIFIGYNRFRADRFASAHFSFRRAGDQQGGYFQDALLKAGEDSYDKGGLRVRWGDYSSTVVDPADDLGFWTLQEYAASRTEAGTSQWGTWWTKFSQRNGACTFRLDRASADVPFTANVLRTALTTSQSDCTRVIAPNASWISLVSSTASQGPATLEFQVKLNKSNKARSATITIGDQTFTVNQAANPVPPPQEPVLTITSFEAPASARIGDSLTVTTNVKNTGSRGAGTFRIAFYLSTRTPVTSKDVFTGFGCPVNQGLLADETISCSGNFQIGSDLSPGTYYLAAIADDREQISMSDRSGSVRGSDAGPLTLRAAASAPAISSAGFVNGASARTGALAPGLIFVMYGARLGPVALTTLTLDADGKVSTTLAGTRVLFDGVAAPLIYTAAGQVSGIVPYSVAGKQTVRVEAVFNGLRGDALTLPVAASAPALFSVDFSGLNQVAALNEDGSVNSSANPIDAGKLIVLYGTGAGTFRSQPADGAVIGLPLPEFLTPLSLEIGGQPAELVYAGPAPGLVSGVFQINARVPVSVSGDKVPVTVRSGGIASIAGTTIAVK
jgi:uncharacterized protein (TIGR03437 family)